MNEIAYRPIGEGDVSGIARVHRRACLIAYDFMNWAHTEDEVGDWYRNIFGGWDWGLVAETADRIVGFAATSGVHLDQLFVDPLYQRRGIGTVLLTTALRRTPPIITLNVFEENLTARRFYERHRFQEAGSFFNNAEKAIELVYLREG
jgi:ribosomal protein S18 acetylase RimI-like enzyme